MKRKIRPKNTRKKRRQEEEKEGKRTTGRENGKAI